jgi:hypothetical protein
MGDTLVIILVKINHENKNCAMRLFEKITRICQLLSVLTYSPTMHKIKDKKSEESTGSVFVDHGSI